MAGSIQKGRIRGILWRMVKLVANSTPVIESGEAPLKKAELQVIGWRMLEKLEHQRRIAVANATNSSPTAAPKLISSKPRRD